METAEYWIVLYDLLSLPFNRTQDPCPGVALPSEMGPSTSNITQENVSQTS